MNHLRENTTLFYKIFVFHDNRLCAVVNMDYLFLTYPLLKRLNGYHLLSGNDTIETHLLATFYCWKTLVNQTETTMAILGVKVVVDASIKEGEIVEDSMEEETCRK